MANACIDGEDRFGAVSPATGSDLNNLAWLLPRLAGRNMSSVALSTSLMVSPCLGDIGAGGRAAGRN